MNVRDPGVPTVRSPADLLAVVPYLLGFHPTESVVVLALTGPRITFLGRGDLPTPGAPRADIGDLVDYLAAITARQRATGTILIGYGPPQQVTPVIDLARQIFPRHRLAVREALRITDGRYFSYLCTDPACCPPDGVVVVDPASSPLAAHATVVGLAPLPDRAALAATVAPVGGPARQAMIEATDRAMARLADLIAAADTDGHPPAASGAAGGPAPSSSHAAALARRVGADVVARAVRHHRGGGRLSDDDAAWLTVLLQHPAVRDLAWQLTDGHVEDLPLWTDLTRRAHHEVVAAPATLLGLAAWRCGDGALAAVALDRALQADPGHRMAVLLARALRAGMPPSALGDPPPFSSADPHGLGLGRHDGARASHPSTQ